MSDLVTAHAPASPPAAGRGRAPLPLWAAAVLTWLLAVVTSYGSIYFSFYFEDPDPGWGSWLFVVVFIAIAALASGSAVAMVRGSATGRRVLVGYGVLGIAWCVAKLVFWHEAEALVFGAVNVAVLALLAARRGRAFTR
jgi:hypothetical protein